MEGLTIPQPQDDPEDEASDTSGGDNCRAEQPQRRRAPIASEEDCLRVLSTLGGLVALGTFSTAQANTIRSIYTAILQHHQRQQAGPARLVVNEQELARQLRNNPELATLLEPLLTEQQIENLVRSGRDADESDDIA